jgi:hypothetical protein
MKLTQEEIILAVLEDINDWTPSYNIIKVNTKWGWLGTGADREARRLAEQGIIQRKREGKYTYFRKIKDNQLCLC